MPDPNKFDNQKDFMGACMHQALKVEKRPQDQAVAMCLNMWRNRKKKKSSKKASITESDFRIMGKKDRPTVFLAGACNDGNEWREALKKGYKEIRFIDPYKEDYDPEKDVYDELAAIAVADHVVFYKGGKGSEKEREFLKRIEKAWKDFEDLDKLRSYLDTLIDPKKKSRIACISRKIRQITAKYGVDYDYSCLMLNASEEVRKKVLSFSKSIPDSEIYEGTEDKGRENHIHATVLYGMLTDDASKVKDVLKDFKKFEVVLGEISMFSGGRGYDVLKVSVHSPELQRLHSMLKENIEGDYGFPVYLPHMTIAYLKRGFAVKYIGRDDFDGMKFKVESLIFSPGEGKDTRIDLA